MIKRLLVINRGEIACRILRTAQALGIDCAAVYSPADRNALHTLLADRAFALRGNAASDSYLDQQQILAIAADWGADAIHPGYGFLSENSDFARAVENAGIRFVGPGADAIAAMGSKARAKQLMAEAGVPMLPGYHGDAQDVTLLREAAQKVGYPVLLKAVSGGGGRGLRVVNADAEFDEALAAVQRESQAAFGDQRVLLEKYLTQARHVEIQVFADDHDNCVHLHERDCSVQRRHQKLIEEAPAPGLAEHTREAMGAAAVRAATSIGYSGAGTVEFLYQGGEFYFLEMNTRLQVEHPVTECITGLDLVEWQLRVASGETLPLTQADIARRGWAIEARINAESGAPDFLPSTGLITALVWPQGEALRVDAGFRSGDRVSVFYDSMLGKLIASAPTRAEAIEELSQALAQLRITGISHNADFLGAVLDTSAFRAAELHTGFLTQHEDAIAVALRRRRSGAAAPHDSGWAALAGWRQNQGQSNTFSQQYHLRPLYAGAAASAATDINTLTGTGAQGQAQQALKAPLPGRIIKIHVAAGDSVVAGQPLLVMEAMKMEHTLKASADASIEAVHCDTDDMVQPDQLLMAFVASDAP
ncbi:acetyl/propionyl/methylcrotonyl-CoA carboxylase subunit alpha [Pseudohongiella sp.]|uniref:Biotin carboxylase n=2 Tax=root TaxID=1 RepID=A0A0F9YHT2_9ZZZZ|nr:biotin carboxylase N-terminal domain-containing protein [Pseudohongiella sp.]HDZ08975.1 ATP-grasp domain-containing protein [Pseudohongiella sp.]HEA62660.1 ATP-grasp domain-containing protein [Pseudohongiella sp.]